MPHFFRHANNCLHLQVILNFNSLGVGVKPSPAKFDDLGCFLADNNSSSENDTENYSEDDDEASDLENNLSERKSMCTLPTNALLNSKKGAFLWRVFACFLPYWPDHTFCFIFSKQEKQHTCEAFNKMNFKFVIIVLSTYWRNAVDT